MMQYMYQKYQFRDELKFDQSKFQTLSLKVQAAYRDSDPNVSYHTSTHGADVIQSVYYYMNYAGIQDMLKATTFDLASLFLSAAAHDVDHPGNNNLFETKTHSKLAVLYNDQGVLENHHAATFFFLLEDESCNILSHLSGEDYNRMRKYIVDNILYTDMSKHFSFLNEIKGLNQLDNFDPSGKQKPDIMKALVHAADIGNPTRPFEISKIWTMKILSEFFAQVRKIRIYFIFQGDRERSLGLDISMLCDRKTTNVGRSQIGFIDFVVLPYFEALASFLPGIYFTVNQMKANKEAWSASID